jgi:AP endonuclease-2
VPPFEFENQDEDMTILKKVDCEGRFLMCSFGVELAIVNLYCPNDAGDNEELAVTRLQDRRVFFAALRQLTKHMRTQYKNVFVVGDFNVSYLPLDHCDYSQLYRSLNLSVADIDAFIEEARGAEMVAGGGTLLEDFYNDHEKPIRRWFYKWLKEDHVVDCFRKFHPTESFRYTCWSTKVSARVSNHGTRIDTILYAADDGNSNEGTVLIGCDLMSDYQGSDHCPVWVDIENVRIEEGVRKGAQSKVTLFFTSKASNDNVDDDDEKREIINVKQTQTTSKKRTLSMLDYTTKVDTADEPDTTTTQSAEEQTTTSSPIKSVEQSEKWSALFKEAASRQKPVPLCPKHRKECTLLRVTKKGASCGRQFYICSVPVPDRCDFFQWFHR